MAFFFIRLQKLESSRETKNRSGIKKQKERERETKTERGRERESEKEFDRRNKRNGGVENCGGRTGGWPSR